MRRAITLLASLGLALTALSGVASAAPTVTFKAVAVPISGYPHTGNILGAGAAVQAEYTIAGTEYAGFPPPLIGVNFYLPKGAKLHPSGFKSCPAATLEPSGAGPGACPKGSSAGPVGEALGVVFIGGEGVKEKTTIESFYAPGGGLEFYTSGHSPVSLELLSKGHYVSGGSYGPKLVSIVPLVESLPGAPDASVVSIKVKVGSAMKQHGKTVYYGTMPTKCPKGGFPVKTELMFEAEDGFPVQTVTKTYNAPCPRK